MLPVIVTTIYEYEITILFSRIHHYFYLYHVLEYLCYHFPCHTYNTLNIFTYTNLFIPITRYMRYYNHYFYQKRYFLIPSNFYYLLIETFDMFSINYHNL